MDEIKKAMVNLSATMIATVTNKILDKYEGVESEAFSDGIRVGLYSAFDLVCLEVVNHEGDTAEAIGKIGTDILKTASGKETE